jgi:hypothetical protein
MRQHHVCLVFLIGLGYDAAAREFGPEWTRAPDGYRKELKVPVVNFGFGATNYDVRLESDGFNIAELDDNKGFSIRSPKYGHFELRKKPDGTLASYWVHFPEVQYWDLNGDGILDLMQDRRGLPAVPLGPEQKTFIFLDGCFVPVWGSARSGSATRTAYSPDRKIEYIFEDGKWRLKMGN